MQLNVDSISVFPPNQHSLLVVTFVRSRRVIRVQDGADCTWQYYVVYLGNPGMMFSLLGDSC